MTEKGTGTTETIRGLIAGVLRERDGESTTQDIECRLENVFNDLVNGNAIVSWEKMPEDSDELERGIMYYLSDNRGLIPFRWVRTQEDKQDWFRGDNERMLVLFVLREDTQRLKSKKFIERQIRDIRYEYLRNQRTKELRAFKAGF